MKQNVKLRKKVANSTVSAAAYVGMTTGIIATAAGLTTGTIEDNLKEMSEVISVNGSGTAAHIIILPTPTPGKKLVLLGGADGYELRSSSPTTVYINGVVDTASELAIAASRAVECICYDATHWTVIDKGYGVAGA